MFEISNLLYLILFGIYGLFIGSFLCVIADRFIIGESIIYPPSHCPTCGTKLKPHDLIPILSWLFLRGKCRYCHTRIHWQYPLVEAITGLLWGLIAWRFGWSLETVVGLLFVSFLIPLSAIDIREWILPNVLTYPFMIIALLCRFFIGSEPWWWYVMGGALGAGILFILAWISPYLFGKEGMGLGDVKLMAGIGTVVGITGTVLTLFFASALGLLIGLILKSIGRLDQQGYLPFGPLLSVGGVIAYIWGIEIWNGYLSLIVRG